MFIDDGAIVLEEYKDKLMNEYGIIRVSEDNINNIDSNDYLKYFKYKNIGLVLVKDKKIFSSKYPEYEVDRPSLENILLVYMRGEKNE